ncbi:MAG: aromatic ring-hydroxylating dioxygenase subunit alpha [Myxococcota bacterium]
MKVIRDKWYVVLDVCEVPHKKPVGFTRFGQKMVFWRDQEGRVSCQADRCCHRGAQLSLGAIVGNCIECPFHGWRFDQRGQCTLVPSNGKNARIPKKFKIEHHHVREAYGWIWMYWGDVEDAESLPEIPFFEELKDKRFRTTSYQEEWPVHYTRSIENQLDVTHLAFTHRKTIGDINKPVVDGPLFQWTDEDTIRFYPVMNEDRGQVAKKANELKEEDLGGFLEFRFPNQWKLKITDKFYNFAAFVPVDETTTITYVRVYQRFVSWPLLGDALTWLMGKFNQRVLGEDRPMVISQDPIFSELHMDEMLVPGDVPIMEFRKRQYEILNAQAEKRPVKAIAGKSNGSAQLAEESTRREPMDMNEDAAGQGGVEPAENTL